MMHSFSRKALFNDQRNGLSFLRNHTIQNNIVPSSIMMISPSPPIKLVTSSFSSSVDEKTKWNYNVKASKRYNDISVLFNVESKNKSGGSVQFEYNEKYIPEISIDSKDVQVKSDRNKISFSV